MGKNKASAAGEHAEDKKPWQRFVRVVEFPPVDGTEIKGYQAEVIYLDSDNQVVKRKLVDKKNLFEYAYSQALDIVDPRLRMEDDE